MSAGPDPAPQATHGEATAVAAELEAIFADAGPDAGTTAAQSKVRAVASRRARIPYATAGAVAAAGLAGLSAGALMVRAHAADPPAPPAAARTVPAAPPVVPVQVAAPTVTLPAARNGPIPVIDDTPVAPRAAMHKVRSARHRPAAPSDLMAADRRLRAAYAHAVRAGVPRRILVDYRDRWADLRHDAAWRPDRVAAGYGAMSADLERMARHSHGRQPTAPRYRLFDFFS